MPKKISFCELRKNIMEKAGTLQEVKDYVLNMVQEDIQVQETLRYQRENLSTCQHQVQRIQNKMKESQGERKGLHDNQIEFGVQLQGLTTQQMTLDAVQTQTSGMIVTCEGDLKKNTLEYEALHASMKQEDERLQMLKKRAALLSAENEKHDQKMEQLSLKTKVMWSDLGEQQIKHARLQAKHKHLKQRVDELGTQRESLGDENKEVQQSNVHLTGRIEGLKQVLDLKSDSYTTMTRGGQRDIDAAQRCFEKTKAEADKTLQEEETKMRKSYNECTEHIQKMNHGSNAMEMEIEDALSLVLKLHLETELRNHSSKQLEAEGDQLQTQCKVLQETTDANRLEIRSLNPGDCLERSHTVKLELVRSRAEETELREHVIQVRCQLQQSQSSLNQLYQEYEKMKVSEKEMQLQISNSLIEIQKHTTEISTLVSEHENLEQQASSIKDTILITQEQLIPLQTYHQSILSNMSVNHTLSYPNPEAVETIQDNLTAFLEYRDHLSKQRQQQQNQFEELQRVYASTEHQLKEDCIALEVQCRQLK